MARKHVNGQGTAKGDLPSKLCQACGRPFVWRRKWARDWEAVKVCSDRCRAALRRDGPTGPSPSSRPGSD
ncbi:DUF2256 domain-containing protein [Brevundimonas sp. S30B]|uniref:DUF2256 domain-containing protein n=1 Tax=unclassified Brevundimonas TaxID=2622653 RepID=UPI001071C722|nr:MULTISPECIES: DUF2256 domain-containing protein [unclassified Brevundimonas]QBX37464.1 DUF2256 domain-containing protein [Brevundimonas sp. MF30-B]TFW03743.1 DUF2256 domain-containing protein [Brevundimonas sp. S30B]